MAYYRMKGKYEGKSRYNRLHISFTTVAVVDTLERLGYVENHKGHYDRTGTRASHKSRMRAHDKLIQLIIGEHKITPQMIEKHPETECIILRNSEKTDIDYEDTAETARMRQDLCTYNNQLRRSHIDISRFPENGIPTSSGKKQIKIDRNDKFVRRIFNDSSWEKGGRYHGGWWQRMPKKWRKKILIDGQETVEVDYSGLHIVLLYALENIDYWETIGTDPYRLKSYEQSDRMRSLLKLVLLVSLNAKDKRSAVKGIQSEINKDKEQYQWVYDEGIKLEDLIDEFSSVHAPISKYFFSGIGITLQNVDSRIAEIVINEFTSQEIPLLAIHDSFVVPEQHAETLDTIMKTGFMEVTWSSKNGHFS